MKRIGRQEEYKVFQNIYISKKSEFIALYERRRVGKPSLIRSFLNESNCTFQMTGSANATLAQQLLNLNGSR